MSELDCIRRKRHSRLRKHGNAPTGSHGRHGFEIRRKRVRNSNGRNVRGIARRFEPRNAQHFYERSRTDVRQNNRRNFGNARVHAFNGLRRIPFVRVRPEVYRHRRDNEVFQRTGSHPRCSEFHLRRKRKRSHENRHVPIHLVFDRPCHDSSVILHQEPHENRRPDIHLRQRRKQRQTVSLGRYDRNAVERDYLVRQADSACFQPEQRRLRDSENLPSLFALRRQRIPAAARIPEPERTGFGKRPVRVRRYVRQLHRDHR